MFVRSKSCFVGITTCQLPDLRGGAALVTTAIMSYPWGMTERTFTIQTFGCQMNVNDSLWLARALVARGFTQAGGTDAAIHIINTCSVRDKPEQKVYSALGAIRRLAKTRQAKGLATFAVVAGCVAQQIGKGLFERFEQVRLVVGSDGLVMAPAALERLCAEPGLRLNYTDFSEQFPERDPALGPGTRVDPVGYVNIMQGCNNFCAYCIVPFTRGRQKSRASAAIVDECRALLASGAKELVLLGQNVNAFGQDSQGDGTSFADLLYMIGDLPGLERLRFVTPHPKDFSAQTVEADKDLPVISSRLHLPVQAGSDAVLERMKRRYTRDDFLRLVGALYKARPDIAISTDIIVGFPGETEDDVQATLDMMRAVPFVGSYSFCYSDRPGALAVSFTDKVPQDVALERLERVQSLQDTLTAAWFFQCVGRSTRVLLESPSRKNTLAQAEGISWQGRDQWGNPVNVLLPETVDAHGLCLDVRIDSARKHSLVGVGV